MPKQLTEEQILCIQCQECCKTMAMSINKDAVTKETIEFFKARGCEMHYVGNVMWVIMPSICPNLTTFGCKIYSTRPDICRIYDGRKLPFMDKTCRLYKLGVSTDAGQSPF